MKRKSIEFLPVSNLPLIKPDDDLAAMVIEALAYDEETLQDDDIVVFAQKVVSKSEGRLVNLADIEPSPRALEITEALNKAKDPRHIEVILGEAKQVIWANAGIFIVETHQGYVCANAGVDRSNIEQSNEPEAEWLCLLPVDADASAAMLRARFKELAGVEVAVLINDTHGRPFRNGGIGVALGSAGLGSLVDQRGQSDLFGYTLQATLTATGDEIAAAASLVMGQAAEATPVVIIRGLRYAKPAPNEDKGAKPLIRPASQDIFRYPPGSEKWRESKQQN